MASVTRSWAVTHMTTWVYYAQQAKKQAIKDMKDAQDELDQAIAAYKA